jgi:hypothetical protein
MRGHSFGMSKGKQTSWVVIAYYSICVLIWAAYLGFEPLNYAGVIHLTVADLAAVATEFFASFSDPVLRVIVYILVGALAVALVPGFIVVGFWLLVIALSIGIFSSLIALFVTVLVMLAKVSVTGTIVAAVIGGVVLFFTLRALGRWLLPHAWRFAKPVVETLYGIFLDWWLTPLLRRRKERRIVNELENKRRQCELIVVKLQEQDPQALSGLSQVGMNSDTWLERVLERFHDRDRQKSMAERTKLITLAKQYFGEYRAMLEAKDELSLANRDAGIRRMEREKKELTLQNEIGDLRDDAATRNELRGLDREKDRLTKRYEIDQLKKKMNGERDDGPYREAMNDKKARRLVDIQDHLFESLEHPVSTDMEARLLYKQLQKKIDRHPELSDNEKDELLERLERRWKQTFGKASATPIFEEE